MIHVCRIYFILIDGQCSTHTGQSSRITLATVTIQKSFSNKRHKSALTLLHSAVSFRAVQCQQGKQQIFCKWKCVSPKSVVPLCHISQERKNGNLYITLNSQYIHTHLPLTSQAYINLYFLFFSYELPECTMALAAYFQFTD